MQAPGVFASGDYAGMGSFLCGQIPRVRTMRKWFGQASDLPPGYSTTAINHAGVGGDAWFAALSQIEENAKLEFQQNDDSGNFAFNFGVPAGFWRGQRNDCQNGARTLPAVSGAEHSQQLRYGDDVPLRRWTYVWAQGSASGHTEWRPVQS